MEFVPRQIHSDPVDPGLETGIAAEIVQTAVSADKRVLNDLLGIVMVAEQSVSQPVQFAGIGLDQFVEPFAAALFEVCDQLFFVVSSFIIHNLSPSPFDRVSAKRFRSLPRCDPL